MTPQPLPNLAMARTDDGARVADDRGYQRLAAQILELMGAGEFPVGAKLPSERTLAERFDVSRTLVREAIIALEIQGLVEVRGGSGIYVCATRGVTPASFQLSAGPGPIELLRARALIESEVAGLAASERKDSDLDRIFAALVAMRENMHDKPANEAADRQFHQRIAEATGNGVLLQMVSAMWDRASDPVWTQIEQHFHTPELRLASQDDHQRIFASLMARDAGAARAAMRGHIERVIHEFTQAWR